MLATFLNKLFETDKIRDVQKIFNMYYKLLD